MTSLFLQAVTQGPLLADGAMGTLLLQQGFSGCLEALLLEKPEIIQKIHQAYQQSGSQIFLTHTFGANRLALAKFDLQNSVDKLNQQAVTVLRQAIDASEASRTFVLGCIGPSQLSVANIQKTKTFVLHEAFFEQASSLAKSGVDGLVLETFFDLKELSIALEAVQKIGLPLVASVTLTTQAKLLDGGSLDELAALLDFYKPDLAGLNCSDSPKIMWPVFQKWAAKIKQPLWVKLNAGHPSQTLSPKAFADECRSYLEHGVGVLGGCCGTTPDHITKLRLEVAG